MTKAIAQYPEYLEKENYIKKLSAEYKTKYKQFAPEQVRALVEKSVKICVAVD